MKIITANVNDIKAAQSKRFFNWLTDKQAYNIYIQKNKITD